MKRVVPHTHHPPTFKVYNLVYGVNMNYLKVKDWEKFQHYKDRNPPWIKLSRDLLRDYEFQCLQDASKLHLMLIWLLASQMDNKIPADKNFIKNQIGIKGDVNLKELIDKGYLIDDSGALAGRKQVAMVETEAEAYSKETYIGDFESFWSLYGKIGDKQRAKKAWEKIKDTTYESIIEGHARYKIYCEANEWYHKQHLSTWLNSNGWESEWHTNAKPKKELGEYSGMFG